MRTLCEQASTEEPWHVCKKTALQFDIHVAGWGEGSEHGAVYVARITHSCINTNIVNHASSCYAVSCFWLQGNLVVLYKKISRWRNLYHPLYELRMHQVPHLQERIFLLETPE